MTIAPDTREAHPTGRPRTPDSRAAVSKNGSNVRFTPIPDEEFDDGDIEVTPELLKEPSLYPALSLIQPIKGKLSGSSRPSAPASIPSNAGGLMHAGVDIAGNRGEKSLLPRQVVYSGQRVPMA